MSAEDGVDSEQVVELGSLSLDGAPPREGKPRNVEDTRARLAFCLLALVAAVMGVLLGLLASASLTTQSFDSTVGVVLAPLFALLGAATGYYYGQGDR